MIIIKIKVEETNSKLDVEMVGKPEGKITFSENLFAIILGPKLNELLDQVIKQIPSEGEVKHEIPFTMIVKKTDGKN